MTESKTNHSKEFIFVCPERIFLLEDDGKIPSQPAPVDYWLEGRCSYCKVKQKHLGGHNQMVDWSQEQEWDSYGMPQVEEEEIENENKDEKEKAGESTSRIHVCLL
jgi:hypothetical protein